MKKVTVIIPVYNVEKYLQECLDSIVNQTFGIENLEVIIVNDGSIDNSERIIQGYLEKYKDWIYIKQKNMGLSYSRNIGIDNATTDYIIFVDSDDYLSKNAIEILYKIIIKEDVDIVTGKNRAFNSKGEYKVYTEKIYKNTGITTYKQNKNITELISSCGKLYKKSIILNNKFIVGVKHEDIWFSLNLYLNNYKVYLINDVIYFRRFREEIDNKSITQNLDYSTFNDLLINYKKVIENNKIDFYFEKVLVKKLNKYIMKNINVEDVLKAFKDCKNLLNSINFKNRFLKKYFSLYNYGWNCIAKIYIKYIRS